MPANKTLYPLYPTKNERARQSAVESNSFDRCTHLQLSPGPCDTIGRSQTCCRSISRSTKRGSGFMARFTLALLMQSTVSFPKLALVLSRGAKPASNERRIQRFMSGYALDFGSFGHFLLQLVPQRKDFVVSMDRTRRTPCAEVWTYQYEHPHDRHLL